MHLWLKLSFGLLLCSFLHLSAWAGHLSATLTTQVELLSSCVINGQNMTDATTGVSFGQIDFGTTTAAFHGIIQSKLTHGAASGLQIRCSGAAPIKITFAAGQHDQKVPAAFTGRYFRALSNGQDFLAYHLVLGSSQQILSPNTTITLDNNGQNHVLDLAGQVINNGHAVSRGSYTDVIPITIEF